MMTLDEIPFHIICSVRALMAYLVRLYVYTGWAEYSFVWSIDWIQPPKQRKLSRKGIERLLLF